MVGILIQEYCKKHINELYNTFQTEKNKMQTAWMLNLVYMYYKNGQKEIISSKT